MTVLHADISSPLISADLIIIRIGPDLLKSEPRWSAVKRTGVHFRHSAMDKALGFLNSSMDDWMPTSPKSRPTLLKSSKQLEAEQP